MSNRMAELHKEMLSCQHHNISQNDNSHNWFQIVIHGDAATRKRMDQLMKDMRDEYESTHGDKFVYGEMFQCVPPYDITITPNHDGYVPSWDIIGRNADMIKEICVIGSLGRAEDNLRPCPFCGSHNVELATFAVGEYDVICHDCGIALEPTIGEHESSRDMDMKRLAIERWNRRV